MKYIPLFTISLFFLSAAFSFSQTNIPLTEDGEVKAYSRAIAEYIKAVYKKDKTVFDTLFIGKHEDFPEIKLPASIQDTKVFLLKSEEADKKASYRKLVYLNVIGNISKDHSHFVIVTFNLSKQRSYVPQYNCLVDLKYNSNSKKMELVKLKFDYVYTKEK